MITSPSSIGQALLAFGRMVRLSHTLFGLPFALSSTALAHAWAREHGGEGLSLTRLVLIVLAFTGARTAAMGFNRIVDCRIDALNPRTADRELPAGTLSMRAAWILTVGAAILFVGASAGLGTIPLMLAPPCLVVVCSYSLFKRFSWSAHLMLGVALALAPGGAWVAVTGGLAGWPTPLWLMAAVATWVAGFDVLYSLADLEFDRAQGLHSIPARFGVHTSLVLSAALHVATLACLVGLHLTAELGWAHACGVLLIGALLAVEHWIVRPGDLSKLGRAFFDINGWISLAYLACTTIEVWRAI